MTRRNAIIISILLLAAAVGVIAIREFGKDEQERVSLPVVSPVFAATSPIVIPLGISVAEAANLPEGVQLAPADIAITGPRGERMGDVSLALVQEEGEYRLSLKPESAVSFKPGKYHIAADIDTGRGIRHIEQDFLWGVLAVNPNKSVYRPGETAKLALAVLDEEGNMVCNAALKLQITNNKSQTTLSTDEGSIVVNKECMMKNVTQKPDYEADYTVGDPGIYQMTLTAATKNGTYTIEDYFEVKDQITFDIERSANTRIYPHKAYPVNVSVIFEGDFSGVIEERVPAEFEVIRSDKKPDTYDERVGDALGRPHARVRTEGAVKVISWDIVAKKGETVKLGYRYDAPDISPEFYLLGPLRFEGHGGNKGNKVEFREPRQWQIAVDAIALEQSVTATGVKSDTLALPSWTPAANELILVSIATRDTSDTPTSVSGNGITFTQVLSVDDSGTISKLTVFRGMSASPSTGQITFSWAETTTTRGWSAVASRFSGVDTSGTNGSGAVEASNSQSENATNPSISITTLTANAVAWGAFGWRGSALTLDGSVTPIVNNQEGGTSGDRVDLSAGYKAVASPGSATINGTNTLDDWAEGAISIKPAASNATPTITSVTDTPDPTNPNRSVTFSTDWNDADSGETVKVKICSTDALGADQVCDGTTYATSTAFTTSDPESVVYNVQGGDAGTTITYYAFVCDDSAACNASGTSGTVVVNAASTVPNVKFR